MKQHLFFAWKVGAVLFHHCFAFHIVYAIHALILNSFDRYNWILDSCVECSLDIFVFLTASRQLVLVKYSVIRLFSPV